MVDPVDTWYHWSKCPPPELRPVEQDSTDPHPYAKPRGLWFSVGNEDDG